MAWMKITFNACYILAANPKSYKILIPRFAKSEYDYFYVPRGCVQPFSKDYRQLCIPADMPITLKSNDYSIEPNTIYADELICLLNNCMSSDENYKYIAPELTPETPTILTDLIDE